MAGRQSTLGKGGMEFELQIFKSHRSFSTIFDDAKRLFCVTYCSSPDLLLDLFIDYELEEMEVVVGDVDDYREELVGQPNVADRLEELKQEEKLRIYTCPTKTVHSKLYEIEHTDGSLTLLCGSPNLTKTGWGNQTNAATVVRTEPESDAHHEFRDAYEDHRDSYGELFLDDLTDEIEIREEDRRTIVERYVEGRVSTADESEEFRGELSDQIVSSAPDVDEDTLINSGGSASGDDTSSDHSDGDASNLSGQDATDDSIGVDSDGDGRGKDSPVQPGERELVQSLKNYSDRFRDNVSGTLDDYGRVSKNSLRITPVSYAQQTQKAYGVPIMRIKDEQDAVYLGTPNGEGYFGDAPPDDPVEIRRALEHLEAYFQTVEKHADSRDTLAFQTHLYEALLYVFWAPFVNRHARAYKQSGIRNLDKRLPFLYIHGDSNSGKGTFARFVLHLISGGQVTTPMDADEFGKRLVREVRTLKTSFPLVIDDVQKSTIHRTDTLRNFWSGWAGSNEYPALVFVSNDTKPKEWFRNRAKVLHFDGRFTSGVEGEVEVNRIIDRGSPIFHWFVNLYFDRDIQPRDDVLHDARDIFSELYARAEMNLPPYFPEEPAEDLYDIGRRKWRQAHEDGKFSIRDDGDVLRLEFTNDMEGWEIAQMQHDLPPVGIQKLGNELVIDDTGRFRDWLLEDSAPEEDGLVATVRSVLGRGR